MSACARHLEDLALLAGGDLPGEPAGLLRQHVAGCAACRALLDALEADLTGLQAIGHAVDDSEATPIVGAVMARLTAEACAQGRPAAPTMVDGRGLGTFARAAAIILAVIGASILGFAALQREQVEMAESAPRPAEAPTSVQAMAEVPPAPAVETGSTRSEGLPIFLKTGAGRETILSWATDGREARQSASTYRVLASSSPTGFEGARPVEVAGSQLVADTAWPSSQLGDRSITYFRVE